MKNMSKIYKDASLRYHVKIQKYPQPVSERLAEMGERPCVVKITWMEQNKRRDVDNIQSAQKFILDALQTYGILQNDSQKYVRQIFHTIVPAERTQVIVELIPCQMAVVNGVVM